MDGGRSVLIVEDEQSLRNMLMQAFEKAGYLVESAGDGKEALEKLANTTYSVIITDIMMPVMDGVEMIEHIRADSKNDSIPIVALTNIEPDQKNLARLEKNSPSYYLLKSSCTLEEVVNKVENLLG